MRRLARPLLTLAALLLPALLAAACARYEWKNELEVPGACPRGDSAPAPPPRPVGAPGGRVLGRVLTEAGAPAVGAQVVVVGARPPRGALVDTLGYFALDSLAPGEYLLRVRQIGRVAQERRVAVRPGPGPALDVTLPLAMLDGPCSGFAAVRVRKPWWKWW